MSARKERERPARLRKEERHRAILEALRISPAVRVLDIARRLGVHVQTIRRDLDELHTGGKVNRTYGGAMLVSTGLEPSIVVRDRLLVEERTRIGRAAAALVQAGDVLMIDVGSTTAHFARCLAARGLAVRIITNSWTLVAAVAGAPRMRTILCPGEYSDEQGGVAGADTIDYLRRFHADKTVLSIGGLAGDGLYEFDPDFAWVKRTMLESAKTRILLADRSKFDRKVMTRVCGFEGIDHLVVDERPSGPLLEAIGKAGVRLHLAA